MAAIFAPARPVSYTPQRNTETGSPAPLYRVQTRLPGREGPSQPETVVVLVGGMNIVRPPGVDRSRHGGGCQVQGHGLRLAQFGPLAVTRFLLRVEIIGQLDEMECEISPGPLLA